VAVGVLVWRLTSNGDRAPAPDDRAVTIETREDRLPQAADPAVIPLPPPAESPGEARGEDGPSVDRPAADPVPAAPEPVAEPIPEPVSEPVAGAQPPAEDPAGAEADDISIGAADSGPTPPPLDQVRVEMVFSEDSWVEVRDPRGQRLIYQLGRQGDSRRITGEPPLRVFLGFVDGVTIVVDGEPFRVPAERRLGNTARFTIPLDAGAANGR
jgi:cytoskeleton protein RodZ